jgi:hypothetical protein
MPSSVGRGSGFMAVIVARADQAVQAASLDGEAADGCVVTELAAERHLVKSAGR